MLISYFDTTICNDNLGNSIITEGVLDFFDEVFPEAFLIKIPYIEGIESHSLSYIKRSDFTFFAGTNSLNSHMASYYQWGITKRNKTHIKDVILCGLGWWQYEDEPDDYTKDILYSVLSKNYIHSLRDSYTRDRLRNIGFSNVINTGCPSMWGLTQEHCAEIPETKVDSVIATFTNYNQNPAMDIALVHLLKKLYKKIYLWVQGPQDYEYGRRLCPEVTILPPRLSALDDILRNENIEYVGTRLHAGIRALQHKRRATIIGIDNRAIEISRDTNLPVIPRGDWQTLYTHLTGSSPTVINMPWEAIKAWKSQFSASSR